MDRSDIMERSFNAMHQEIWRKKIGNIKETRRVSPRSKAKYKLTAHMYPTSNMQRTSDYFIWKWYIHTRSALKYSLWGMKQNLLSHISSCESEQRRNQGRWGWSWRDWSWAIEERIFRITSNSSACIYLDAIQVLLIHEFIQFPHSIASKLNLVHIIYWLWFQKISPRKNSNRASQSS